MSGISLIVGLGNPGAQYKSNRHNAGFWFLDMLAHECGVSLHKQPKLHGVVARAEIAEKNVCLFKPDVYMNQSGRALQAIVAFYKIEIGQVLIVHDEIDFPVAQIRLKRGGGHGGHNGLRDIIACLGAGFNRLRIGVGHPGDKNRVVSHVLSNATATEKTAIYESLGCALAVMSHLVLGDFDAAANQLHAED